MVSIHNDIDERNLFIVVWMGWCIVEDLCSLASSFVLVWFYIVVGSNA